ncbi:MAG: hypothetical protein AMJ55_01095 [Gammaproteobacteria bacterium SG8_15]|nr:MAG: hypothetical protein AMJ55_01095 [Gammaproteobacteria bacterium SG8_15]
MITGVAADIVLVIHFLFILFAIFGGLLVQYHRWVIWLHIPAVGWAAMISFAGWICPLTPLENALRRAAGEAAYSGGFINRYIAPVIYPEGYTREIAVVAGVSVLIINILIYSFVIFHKRK